MNNYTALVTHRVLNVIIVLFSFYIIFDGIWLFHMTLGSVTGSSFGMLITIVNMLAQIMILFALIAIDMAIVAFDKKADDVLDNNSNFIIKDNKNMELEVNEQFGKGENTDLND
ncbi:MAG: hypothetical protein ACYCTB_09800 [bacterium]